MFLALCREGEHAWTPTGRKVVILGRHSGAVTVQDLATGEEFEIKPRYLRHAPTGERQQGASVLTLPDPACEPAQQGTPMSTEAT
jgi:hypothetical protein